MVGGTWSYCYPPPSVFDPGDTVPRYYRYVVEVMWSRFLEGTTPSGHAVLVYRDGGELAAAVAAFVTAGLDDGEPTRYESAPAAGVLGRLRTAVKSMLP